VNLKPQSLDIEEDDLAKGLIIVLDPIIATATVLDIQAVKAISEFQMTAEIETTNYTFSSLPCHLIPRLV